MRTDARVRRSEQGFTLVELMLASLITMLVMGVAFTTFQNALGLNEAVVQLSDASQNLRAGTNLLVRDLMQAGRNIDVGGIPIPSGTGAGPLHRPSPPDLSYTFDNTTQTTLRAITTGGGLGPMVNGQNTDLVTILMDDPYLDELSLYPFNGPTGEPRLAVDGASFDVGTDTSWLDGDPANGIAPVKVGDLLYFNTVTGQALQTVTRIQAPYVYFDANDPFNFNQRTAQAGSITQILPPGCPDPDECETSLSVRRIYMFTYYVDAEEDGAPRLMRMLNHFPAQALAGVIEDLELRYDLVDGVNNPTNVVNLPFTANNVTYSASQVRKVNVHVGVRSEVISPKTRDYLRAHVSTVISVRNLAFVDRYE